MTRLGRGGLLRRGRLRVPVVRREEVLGRDGRLGPERADARVHLEVLQRVHERGHGGNISARSASRDCTGRLSAWTGWDGAAIMF